ncbi:MAG: sodium-dependent transporter, partial [Pseudomonadota bacterium]|nr:sodium-dependent transporter [Pseudomonadota bacterium]
MSENKNAIGTENLAWSSHIGFLLACVGAAIGLGNIWKFPYMAGTQGGGAFVLIYLVTIFLIAMPVAAAELITGRMARRNAVDSVIYLARDTKSPALFGIAGLIAVLASFMLLTFYPVISGWVMAYLSKSLLGGFAGFDADQVATEFKDLLANPAEMIFWQVTFL